MKIEEMNIEQIEDRMSEIRKEMDTEGADIEALTAEVRSMNERKEELRNAEDHKKELRKMVAEGAGKTIIDMKDKKPEARTYGADSKEYRNAWLKTMNGEDLSVEERAAYTATTVNTSAVMPTTMLNQIWSLIEEQHPILGDVTVYRTGTIIDVVKHTAIAAGDAATVAENTAGTDENNTFAKVTLSGKDFTKTVKVSYALGKMSIDALEGYLINEISDRLGAAIADDIVTQIGTDMTGGNKVTSAAVKKTTYKELASVFAKLKRAKNVVVYATRATIYNYLVSLCDTSERPIFQLNAQEGAEGYLLGAKVKVEDSIADNKLLIGDPSKYVENMVQDIMIEQAKDIEKHVHVYSGYARCSGALIDPDTFAELDIKQA